MVIEILKWVFLILVVAIGLGTLVPSEILTCNELFLGPEYSLASPTNASDVGSSTR